MFESTQKNVSNNWKKNHHIPMKRIKHLRNEHRKIIPLTTEDMNEILQQLYKENIEAGYIDKNIRLEDFDISINNQNYTISIEVKELKQIKSIFDLGKAEVNGVKRPKHNAMELNFCNMFMNIIWKLSEMNN